MASHLLNSKMEEKAIVSILLSPDGVKVKLMSLLTADHFGSKIGAAAFSVITKIITSPQMSGASDLPDMEVFLAHPDLDSKMSVVLKNTDMSPCTHEDTAMHLYERLEYHRYARILYAFHTDQVSQFESKKKLDIPELVSGMEGTLMSLRTESTETKMFHAGRGSAETAEEMVASIFSDEMPRLILSTFNNFDSVTSGFGCNDLVILASHMKGGKSVIAMNMAVEQYLQGKLDTLYIPLEMSRHETLERVLSKISTVEHTKIRTKTWNIREKNHVRKCWNAFVQHGIENNCRFTVWPLSTLTIPQLRMKVRPMGYDVIFIDYINLLQDVTGTKEEWLRLGNFARDLKLLTKDIDALIVAPTQMNDDGEIRYSKAIKEHANTVWTWMYKEDEMSTHVINIRQPAVRGWAPFPFQLKEDFARM